jgi:fucokinase
LNTNLQKMKNLFLRQSYLDSWEDYEKSLVKESFIKWDYIILTASNEAQAEAYRLQLDYRLEHGFLPKSTHYAVLSDPEGKRVGSGGATFNVMRYIREISGEEECFRNKRILIIHSGGDSKRIPQYSACGKLFSPVPRELPDGRRSTLFDEFIIGLSGVPSRIQDGLLTLSGDVLLLFNPLQIDFQVEGAAAISIKEAVHIGKNHGVFLGNDKGNVAQFLHKMSVEQLRSLGAVNEQGNVNLDTGAILMSSQLANDLLTLISTKGQIDEGKFNEFVNETVRLSFYGDFLYPLGQDSTLEQYLEEQPEGEFSEDLVVCREALWQTIHKYNMKLVALSPAKFIHFGTTGELLRLMTSEMEAYEFLDWKKDVLTTGKKTAAFACSNAYIEEKAVIADTVYIEDSFILGKTQIGENTILSNLRVENMTLPSDITLHGLKLDDGKYVVRIYGIADNPKDLLEKEGRFLGVTLGQWLANSGMSVDQLWDGKDHYLWSAALYPVCDTMEEALQYALLIHQIAKGEAKADEKYIKADRMSLAASFNGADVKHILPWQTLLHHKIRVYKFIEAVKERQTLEDIKLIFGKEGICEGEITLLLEKSTESVFDIQIRIYYYLSKMTTGFQSEELENKCFDAIKEIICDAATKELQYNAAYEIMKDEVAVCLPVRVNWGGGWSDTPPYCNENGGTVLNAALKLNGRLPVQVRLKKIDKACIALASTDSGSYGEFVSLKELQNCRNPYDPFALHKAALIACGIIPMNEEMALSEVLEHLGSGFYLSTEVVDIPRGSGLGTSSILAGACVKGIFEFVGKSISEAELYTRVSCMEQIMSTGGGWQDQVGGLTSGIKLITTQRGLVQDIHVEHLPIAEEVKKELQERFVLIYTGQRRLARHLLREVVGKYIGANPVSVEVLDEIQKAAVLMKFELKRGNIDKFAGLLNAHWELSKKLDAGCTNTAIDQIFVACEDMLAGKMICGAGGGGFLQVILKKGSTKEQLKERLHAVFQDNGVDVWPCELIY